MTNSGVNSFRNGRNCAGTFTAFAKKSNDASVPERFPSARYRWLLSPFQPLAGRRRPQHKNRHSPCNSSPSENPASLASTKWSLPLSFHGHPLLLNHIIDSSRVYFLLQVFEKAASCYNPIRSYGILFYTFQFNGGGLAPGMIPVRMPITSTGCQVKSWWSFSLSFPASL